jgi:lysylphosphatidylglycerol synthetase-like protein (DUF2156 family)
VTTDYHVSRSYRSALKAAVRICNLKAKIKRTEACTLDVDKAALAHAEADGCVACAVAIKYALALLPPLGAEPTPPMGS